MTKLKNNYARQKTINRAKGKKSTIRAPYRASFAIQDGAFGALRSQLNPIAPILVTLAALAQGKKAKDRKVKEGAPVAVKSNNQQLRKTSEIENLISDAALWENPLKAVSSLICLLRELEALQTPLEPLAAPPPPPPPPSPAAGGVAEVTAEAPKFLALRRWLEANGAQIAPGVRIGDAGAAGTGLFTERGLDRHERFISVPRCAMLSAQFGAGETTQIAKICFGDPVMRMKPSLPLALVLANERLIGAASPFAPYVASLPERFSTPLWWGVADFTALRGSPAVLAEAAHKLRAAFKLYLHARSHMAQAISRFGWDLGVLGSASAECGLTWALFRWALSCTSTRQNRVPAPPKVGGWSQCSHSTGASV